MFDSFGTEISQIKNRRCGNFTFVIQIISFHTNTFPHLIPVDGKQKWSTVYIMKSVVCVFCMARSEANWNRIRRFDFQNFY